MKRNIALLFPFVISLICGVSYRVIGSGIAPDGMLVEPFYLLGLSSIFAIIGIFTLIVYFIIWFYKRKRSNIDYLND